MQDITPAASDGHPVRKDNCPSRGAVFTRLPRTGRGQASATRTGQQHGRDRTHADNLLTAEHVAQLLGVGLITVRHLLQTGQLGAAVEAQMRPPSPSDQSPAPPNASMVTLPDEDVARLVHLNGKRDALEVVERLEAVAQKLEKTLADTTSGGRGKVVQMFISEKEAAQMAGTSARTLADRRRARRLPRDIYRQDCRGGKVKYNALKWRKHIHLED